MGKSIGEFWLQRFWIGILDIPPEDWEKTPASVKKLVESMAQRIESLEKQAIELLSGQQQLLEKLIYNL